VAGVLDYPHRDVRLVAARGKGAWANGRRADLWQAVRPEGARIAVSASQLRAPRLQPVWSRLPRSELVPTPAFTPKFAAMLLGDCSAAIHLPVDDRRTFLWDYAAAAMLLAEAGGVFVDWNGLAG
jgi:fructose-1,6-bisphosphatase/inositol monophosphatase family enzyme